MFPDVFFCGVDDGKRGLCRQPVLILWASSSCRAWAINLSPAISKQCSNQWEIISADRWGRLSVALRPVLPPALLISSVLFLLSLCFFPPTRSTPSLAPAPPSTALYFPPALRAPRSTCSEMRQLSSKAINQSHLLTQGMCSVRLVFLDNKISVVN